MFTLVALNRFKKDYKKLVKNNIKLQARVEKTLILLEENPQQKTLGSHKVSLSSYGEVWSSRVTGDVRIIWEYNAKQEIEILLLTIGGHDEVYI